MRCARPTCLIAEEEIVIGLNDFAAIFTSQIEWAAAVKVVNEIDAIGRQGTRAGHALDHVLFAVATRETIRADALVAASTVDASGSVLAHADGTSVEFMLTTDADVIGAASTVKS